MRDCALLWIVDVRQVTWKCDAPRSVAGAWYAPDLHLCQSLMCQERKASQKHPTSCEHSTRNDSSFVPYAVNLVYYRTVSLNGLFSDAFSDVDFLKTASGTIRHVHV